ncbi:XdhC family protein [Peterkaempfera sp. SMS 1(5)a]|uniref:XdhC family protein n=1 Tax=Peterkaempfera podocarpi TaxID=3232308 RepID=UPI0036709F33
MRRILEQAAAWRSAGRRFALATVVRTWSSAPRPPGAAMLVSEDGRVAGSVSGGCVEAAVFDLAQQVLATGLPARESYGVGDDDAFGVGLSCGGTIEVLVRPVDPDEPWAQLAAAAAADRPVALVTTLDGDCLPGRALAVTSDALLGGGLGSAGLDRAAARAARGMLSRGATGILRLGGDGAPVAAGDGRCAAGECEVFVQSLATPPRLLVYGAVEFARALTGVGAFLGYRVTLCDARPVFATAERFPEAHEVVVDWPHRHLEKLAAEIDGTTAICALTHDAKFDVPLLAAALRSRAGYVGAMGSRRTHEERMARLREAGLSRAELARLRSPIGLDLRAHGPEETAVSIAAELVAARRGGSGVPLAALDGPVHGSDGGGLPRTS